MRTPLPFVLLAPLLVCAPAQAEFLMLSPRTLRRRRIPRHPRLIRS
jgi:hypothetical protein